MKSCANLIFMILCATKNVVWAKNHVFKFDSSQFQGEVTLRDMFVDEVANGKAQLLSTTVDKLFGEQEIAIDQNIDATCSKDLQFLKDSWGLFRSCDHNETCLEKYRWVEAVLDAQGRRPSGLQFGNQYWLGSYHQCKAIQAFSHETPPTKFQGRFCKVVLPAKTLEDVLFGICAPKSCSNWNVFNLISSMANFSNFSLECEEEADITKDSSAVIAVSVFLSIAFLVAFATAFEYKLLQAYVAKEEHKVSSSTSILIKGQHKSAIQSSIFCQILVSFSCLSNAAKVFSTKKIPGQIECLHGMRVISLLHVIMYHSVIVVRVVDNNIFMWTIHGSAKALTAAGMMPVDTFFVISGLSLSYNWLKELKKANQEKQLKTPSYWFKFYFYRYVRLTAPYAMILWYYSEVFSYTGSGPLWPSEGHYCNETWWHNLLYFNNYMPKPCMLWSWYLASDFQLFMLSPLILIPLFYYPKMAYGLSSVLIIIGVVARGIVFAVKDYPPNSLPVLIKYGGMTGFFESQDMVYMQTQYRYTPYIIGLIAGHIFFTYKKRRTSTSMIFKLVCWFLTTCYFFAHILIPYMVDYLPPLANAVYSGVTRTTWSLFVVWVIHECITGNANWVNKFLSMNFWLPLSRLSYCAYLIHCIVYIYMRDAADVPFHFHSFTTPIFAFFVCTFITFFLATVAALAFEMPALELNKLFIKRPPTSRLGDFKKIGNETAGAQAV